jgi:hypothetical protein
MIELRYAFGRMDQQILQNRSLFILAAHGKIHAASPSRSLFALITKHIVFLLSCPLHPAPCQAQRARLF